MPAWLVFKTEVVSALEARGKGYLKYFVGRGSSVFRIRWEVED